MYQISRTHLIGYLVEDGITSSVHAKHTFSRTSIMLRFAFCFRSCIILVRTPPARNKRGGGERGQTPPGLLRRQPHASIRKLESTPTPTGYVETLTPASNMGLALFTDTSLRSPPPYFSLHMGHAPSSHLSSDFPLIAPTAAAALTSNGYWRPSRSFGGLTCPQFVPCPGWTPILSPSWAITSATQLASFP